MTVECWIVLKLPGCWFRLGSLSEGDVPNITRIKTKPEFTLLSATAFQNHIPNYVDAFGFFLLCFPLLHLQSKYKNICPVNSCNKKPHERSRSAEFWWQKGPCRYVRLSRLGRKWHFFAVASTCIESPQTTKQCLPLSDYREFSFLPVASVLP